MRIPGRMAGKTGAERIKELQDLSDALDAERKRSQAYWTAATERTGTAWMPGRDADRRMIGGSRDPERRLP
jgi:hypothetical protein